MYTINYMQSGLYEEIIDLINSIYKLPINYFDICANKFITDDNVYYKINRNINQYQPKSIIQLCEIPNISIEQVKQLLTRSSTLATWGQMIAYTPINTNQYIIAISRLLNNIKAIFGPSVYASAYELFSTIFIIPLSAATLHKYLQRQYEDTQKFVQKFERHLYG